MVNRDNWKLTEKYLKYARGRRSDLTLSRDKSGLKHILVWLDSTSVYNAPARVETPFPVYLREQGIKSLGRTLWLAADFLNWVRRSEPRKSGKITDLWIEEFIKPARFNKVNISHDAFSIAEIRQLVWVDDDSLAGQRARAAVALLFLSGMRVGAFVTLPVDLVDLAAGEVHQFPERGVATKFGKRATTFLLDIPDLLQPAAAWDAYIRENAASDALWFAPLTTDGDALAEAAGGKSRYNSVRRALIRLCEQAGVRYRSPHQIRHGHASYCIALCGDVADYKAVSMNLMHDDIATTDRIYTEMRAADLKRRISGLGKRDSEVIL